MHLIVVEFHRHHRPSIYNCDVKMDTQRYMSIHTIVANIARVLDHALSNVLQQPGTPEVILKPEWQSVIVKFAFGPPPDWLWGKYIYFQMLVFALIVCQGSALLVVVWLWLFHCHLAASY